MKRASVLSILLTMLSLPAWAADHRDGSIAQDQPADIADTYAFVNPNDRTRIVLGLTVNPYTVPGVGASFSTDLLYQIKIDNDGDYVEDLVIQAVFDVLGDDQQMTLIGPARPSRRGPANGILRGRRVPALKAMADGSVHESADRGLRVLAGRVDEPFFVDGYYVSSFLSLPGVPPPDKLARDRALSGSPTPGVDLLAGLNVSTIFVELPVGDVTNGSDVVRVWTTVSATHNTLHHGGHSDRNSGRWIQIDRQGLPMVNAAMVPPMLRDHYNKSSPKHDVHRYAKAIAGFLDAKPLLPGDFDYFFDWVTKRLLPDVLTLDVTDPNGLELLVDDAGKLVPSYNGRAPYDDFVDLWLYELTSREITTDGVSANDCTPASRVEPCSGEDFMNGFPRAFPFLGAPHAPEEAIPPRN